MQSVFNGVKTDKIKQKISKTLEEIVMMSDNFKFLLLIQDTKTDIIS